MIKHSIVHWIVEEVLRDKDSLSDYTLRYSLALLMNISLRAIGRILKHTLLAVVSCAMHGMMSVLY